jgi:hypothetical protein
LSRGEYRVLHKGALMTDYGLILIGIILIGFVIWQAVDFYKKEEK